MIKNIDSTEIDFEERLSPLFYGGRDDALGKGGGHGC